jgi:hypothetical protein
MLFYVPLGEGGGVEVRKETLRTCTPPHSTPPILNWEYCYCVMCSVSADRQLVYQILCNYGPPHPSLHTYSGVTIHTHNNTQHSCKQTHVHKITNIPVFYMELILNSFEAGKSIT